MRRLLALASLSVLCGCNPTVTFDVTSSQSASVPGGPIQVTLAPGTKYPFPPVDIASVSGFNSAQTAKDRIQSAHANKLTVTITAPPSGEDLSFLTSVAVQISAPGTALNPVEVAHLSPVPAAASADLVLDDVDLAPYLKATSFVLTAIVSGKSPPNPTTVRGDFTVNIDASVF